MGNKVVTINITRQLDRTANKGMVQKVHKQGSGVGRNQDGIQGAVTDGKWDP